MRFGEWEDGHLARRLGYTCIWVEFGGMVVHENMTTNLITSTCVPRLLEVSRLDPDILVTIIPMLMEAFDL